MKSRDAVPDHAIRRKSHVFSKLAFSDSKAQLKQLCYKESTRL